MNDSCRKISRGQVWFLVDNDVPLVHTQGAVMGKNRPWLVVSNNKCNQSSTVYTVVPLTTAPRNELPTHVTFQTGDKTQTILCEQIRTVSQQAFFNSGSNYLWSMSEKYMNLVDEALAVQLGLSLITTLINDKVDSAINEEIDPQPEKEEPKQEEIEEGRSVEEKRDWVPHEKPKRRHWTDDEKRKFIEYVNTNGAKSAAAFYDLQQNTCYTMKLKFQKELGLNK